MMYFRRRMKNVSPRIVFGSAREWTWRMRRIVRWASARVSCRIALEWPLLFLLPSFHKWHWPDSSWTMALLSSWPSCWEAAEKNEETTQVRTTIRIWWSWDHCCYLDSIVVICSRCYSYRDVADVVVVVVVVDFAAVAVFVWEYVWLLF